LPIEINNAHCHIIKMEQHMRRKAPQKGVRKLHEPAS